jgi:hypothetical protein
VNRIEPGQNQDQITKCDVCGLMVNRITIDEHKKNHENAVQVNPSELLVSIIESEENFVETDFDVEPGVTLEELDDENTVHTGDTIAVILLIDIQISQTNNGSRCVDP